MKTIIYLVGYNRDFIENCNTGWGCGYVMIPTSHPIVIDWLAEKKLEDDVYNAMTPEQQDYNWGYDMCNYLYVAGDQEITYTENKTVNNIDYVVIGFDTAHSYNSEKDNFEYVFNETIKLQNIVDSYQSKLKEQAL